LFSCHEIPDPLLSYTVRPHSNGFARFFCSHFEASKNNEQKNGGGRHVVGTHNDDHMTGTT
jgi:hypothetical protein